MWSLKLITAPTAPALSEDEARAHARILDLPQQAQADLLLKIQAATTDGENFTRRQFITAVWELRLSSWCEEGIYLGGVLRLPKPPVTAVASVKYLDEDGDEQTIDSDDYEIEGLEAAPISPWAQRAEVFPLTGTGWPTVAQRPGAIRIRFTAGYGAASSSVPEAIRQGIALRLGELYERREEQTAGTIQSPNAITARRLWWPFRAF